jgi:hypothetical protein
MLDLDGHGFEVGVGSIEIGAAHEIMAAGTTQLATFVVQLVTATRTPSPILSGRILGNDRAGFIGIS